MTATPLPEPIIHQVQPSTNHYSWEPADEYRLVELSAIPTERHRYLFTADQMTAYELAGYRRGLDAAAKVCTKVITMAPTETAAIAAALCQEMIKELVEEHKAANTALDFAADDEDPWLSGDDMMGDS